MARGKYEDLIIFEARETTQDPVYGTTIEGNWTEQSRAWAEVQDILPSRSESLDDSISIQRRPARIRVDEFDGIGVTSAMRITIESDGVRPARTMRITSGPAFKRDTREIEFVAEELSTSGQEA